MTNDQIKALDALIAEVECGAFLLGAIKGRLEDKAYDAFFGSLDAAKALHEALLPGWFPGMSQNIHHGHWYVWVQDKAMLKDFSAEDNSPARAWLIAILKAYRAQMDA